MVLTSNCVLKISQIQCASGGDVLWPTAKNDYVIKVDETIDEIQFSEAILLKEA